jgi:predicted RND superfamily exporter protein
MGVTGIPLDIATVLTGSVTIGIGIDYAIHFMSFFGKVMSETRDLEQGVREAIRVSGKAILINMIAVSLGFAVLLLSNLVPLQRFGFLISVTMIISGLAALTLLPVILLSGGTVLKKIFVKINTRKIKVEGQRNKKQDQ